MGLSKGSVNNALKKANPTDEEIRQEVEAELQQRSLMPEGFDVEEALSSTDRKSVV
jgi:hypothetical protein